MPLDTAPSPSTDEESARNLEISKRLLRQAQEELDRQDPLQASEEAWGAVAHAVKAVAEKRRWFNNADWRLDRLTTVLAMEQGDGLIATLYRSVREDHYNFYRNCSVSKCPSFLRRQESRIAVSEVPACAGTTGFLTLGIPSTLNCYLLSPRLDTLQVQQVINSAADLVSKLEAMLANESEPPYVGEDVEAMIRRLEQLTSAIEYQRLEQGRRPMEERAPAIPR